MAMTWSGPCSPGESSVWGSVLGRRMSLSFNTHWGKVKLISASCFSCLWRAGPEWLISARWKLPIRKANGVCWGPSCREKTLEGEFPDSALISWLLPGKTLPAWPCICLCKGEGTTGPKWCWALIYAFRSSWVHVLWVPHVQETTTKADPAQAPGIISSLSPLQSPWKVMQRASEDFSRRWPPELGLKTWD